MAEKFGRKLKKYNRAGTALLAGILLASVNVRTATREYPGPRSGLGE